MRPTIHLALVLSLLCPAGAPAQTAGAPAPPAARHNLMPVPASVRFQAGRLPVSKSFSVAYRGEADARLRAGVDRFLRRLEGRTVLELARTPAASAEAATLVVEAAGPGRAVP